MGNTLISVGDWIYCRFGYVFYWGFVRASLCARFHNRIADEIA